MVGVFIFFNYFKVKEVLVCFFDWGLINLGIILKFYGLIVY